MNIIKKSIVFLCLILSIGVISSFAYDVPVCISLNGGLIKMDTEPYLKDGVTYVPLRFLSDVFSAQSINWDEQKREATVSYTEKEIVVKEDSNVAKVNGEEVLMNGIAEITDGRFFVPVRFFADTIDAEIIWNNKYFRVEITKEDTQLSPEYQHIQSYNDDHLYWLAKIIHCESQGESLTGKIGVGNVIINRVLSDDFPDTIYGVIFDRKYGVQFQPVINGSIYKEPESQSYLAAKLVLEGENTVGDSLYFLNPRIATSFWIVNNRNYYTTIGNHDFYL